MRDATRLVGTGRAHPCRVRLDNLYWRLSALSPGARRDLFLRRLSALSASAFKHLLEKTVGEDCESESDDNETVDEHSLLQDNFDSFNKHSCKKELSNLAICQNLDDCGDSEENEHSHSQNYIDSPAYRQILQPSSNPLAYLSHENPSTISRYVSSSAQLPAELVMARLAAAYSRDPRYVDSAGVYTNNAGPKFNIANARKLIFEAVAATNAQANQNNHSLSTVKSCSSASSSGCVASSNIHHSIGSVLASANFSHVANTMSKNHSCDNYSPNQSDIVRKAQSVLENMSSKKFLPSYSCLKNTDMIYHDPNDKLLLKNGASSQGLNSSYKALQPDLIHRQDYTNQSYFVDPKKQKIGRIRQPPRKEHSSSSLKDDSARVQNILSAQITETSRSMSNSYLQQGLGLMNTPDYSNVNADSLKNSVSCNERPPPQDALYLTGKPIGSPSNFDYKSDQTKFASSVAPINLDCPHISNKNGYPRIPDPSLPAKNGSKSQQIKPRKSRIPQRRECSNCGTASTPSWRFGATCNLLCNACALYYNVRGTMRPPSFFSQPVRKRRRAPRPFSILQNNMNINENFQNNVNSCKVYDGKGNAIKKEGPSSRINNEKRNYFADDSNMFNPSSWLDHSELAFSSRVAHTFANSTYVVKNTTSKSDTAGSDILFKRSKSVERAMAAYYSKQDDESGDDLPEQLKREENRVDVEEINTSFENPESFVNYNNLQIEEVNNNNFINHSLSEFKDDHGEKKRKLDEYIINPVKLITATNLINNVIQQHETNILTNSETINDQSWNSPQDMEIEEIKTEDISVQHEFATGIAVFAAGCRNI